MGHGVLALPTVPYLQHARAPMPRSHPHQGDGNSPVSELEGLCDHVRVGTSREQLPPQPFKDQKYIYINSQ